MMFLYGVTFDNKIRLLLISDRSLCQYVRMICVDSGQTNPTHSGEIIGVHYSLSRCLGLYHDTFIRFILNHSLYNNIKNRLKSTTLIIFET